jgi:hypothetical protein
MSNNLYNILGKLQKLDAADKAAKKPITESTQVGTRDIVELLNEKYQGWKKTVSEASAGNKPHPKELEMDAKVRSMGIQQRANDAEKKLAARAQEPKTIGQKIKKDLGEPLSKLARGDIKGALSEAGKPDFLDIDKDGDKKEPMKKAAADKKAGPKKGVNPFAKKEEVEEGVYDAAPKKVDIPAYQRKAKGGDWKVTQQDLDADDEKNISSKAGLAKLKRDHGMNEEQVNEYETDSKGRYVHKGTYGGAATDDGGEDDYDEWGNKKAGAKKTTSVSDAPKKRGRPAKNKGPERVTAKAYKHKGGRVQEAINLDTFVEDAMAEIEGVFITEKAKSKAQQKFMGMVYAAKKGEKPASVEIGDVAKGMSKKSAKDYASTKHKGLPQRVNESREMLTENTLQAIVRKFGKEVRDFAQGGDMDDDLYYALYDYYFDDMPYGVKKARDGDPIEWISEKFDDAIKHGDVEISESNVDSTLDLSFGNDSELTELARLAGLGEMDRAEYIKQQDTKAERTGNTEFNAFGQLFKTDEISEGQCNLSEAGKMCPVHGMVECGSMYESKGSKPDFLDADDDGNTEEPMKKAIADKKDDSEKVDECMSPMGSMPAESESGMSVNASYDTKTGRKTVTVTADGEAAEQLAQMLKMAGMHGHSATSNAQPMHVHSADEMQEEFINAPDEKYAGIDTIIDQGDDLNRKKTQDPATANRAANPMKENVLNLEGRLAAMYNALKIKTK